jgi:hypothetical protein
LRTSNSPCCDDVTMGAIRFESMTACTDNTRYPVKVSQRRYSAMATPRHCP